jgi:hypothetical protein
MRGAEYSYQGVDCTFETIARRHELADPVLWKIAQITQIVHEADIDDGRFDAPEASGLDAVIRELSMTGTDEQPLTVSPGIPAHLNEVDTHEAFQLLR